MTGAALNPRQVDALQELTSIGCGAALTALAAWYDPSDLSTMFQDAAGTTPVTAAGQPVGLILDKSGNGHHASQTTSTARPLFQIDGSGHGHLVFDGVDDYLSTSAFTTVPQPITYFVGVNPTTKPLVGHITDGSATGREFIIFGNSTVEVNAGTTQAAGDYFAATSQINTMVFNGALSAWNRNGGSFTTINPGTQGIDRLFIGANYLGGNTLKGNLYQLIFGAAVYGAPTILEAETWVAEKTGVTL